MGGLVCAGWLAAKSDVNSREAGLICTSNGGDLEAL